MLFIGCCGIITEYNPFHNGHKYQIDEIKKRSSGSEIVVAMSGNFVQRGEPAIFDKYTRAKWALENGADMVLELPVIHALAPARNFALGGISLLSRTGIVSDLFFGAEASDISALMRASEFFSHEPEEFKYILREKLSKGLSYPRAKCEAMRDYGAPDDLADIVSLPNNILGIEYITAINRLNSAIRPNIIRRTGAMHDSDLSSGSYSSATAIRKAIRDNRRSDACAFIPPSVAEHLCSCTEPPIGLSDCSKLLLYILRNSSIEELSQLPNISEGLENLIYDSAKDCGDIFSLIEAIKSKRHTLAKIKRSLMCAMLRITAADQQHENAPYIRVLGIRKESEHLLSLLAERASIPVITRFSDTRALDGNALKMLEKDIYAAEIYSLLHEKALPSGGYFNAKMLVV